MDFVIPHEVTYDFEGRASVSEVARSLLAQEKLLRDAVQVIESCFPALDVEQFTIVVREVTQNSPLRHRLEGIIIGSMSPGLEDDMPADILDSIFGVNVPDSIDSFVSLVLLLIALWGAEKVIQRLKRAKDGFERQRLEAREKRIAEERAALTTVAADHAHIPEEQITESINNVLGKRQVAVGKAAMDFLSPARRHSASGISLPGGASIGADAINSLPSDVEMADDKPPTDSEQIEGVMVTFYAHDRDNPKRWAGTISQVAQGRKPLHLAPDIDAEALFTRDKVKADVIVTSVLDAAGEYVPSVYYLARVYDDAA